MSNPITFDPAAFRALFPAFADATAYPDAVLELRFGVACLYVTPNVYPCGDMTEAQQTYVLQLMVAHLMALADIQAHKGTAGIVTQSKVGDVAVSLAQPPYGTSAWRYWLNLTPYGVELLGLLGVLAAPGMYVGGLSETAAFRKVAGVF